MATKKPIFDLGTTFLMDAAQSHLRVLISDPGADPNNVVVVGLTSSKAWKDRTCVIARGAHPWVTHETCVDYRRAMCVTLDQLLNGKDKGALKLQEPMPTHVLKAIWEEAGGTEFFPGICLRILKEQGFVK